MSRLFNFAPDEYYHLYNRGTDKRDIFMDRDDYFRFFILLYLANGTEPVHLNNYRGLASVELFGEDVPGRLVDIGAYCLMPNHFHLLVKEIKDGGLSIFMHKLLTAYTMYFNKKHERSGSLFQGTFKARHAASDDYLKYLFAYIHLNPVKLINSHWKDDGGIKNLPTTIKYLNNYRYSSFLDYVGQVDRPEKVILNPATFPEYFSTREDNLAELVDWLIEENTEA